MDGLRKGKKRWKREKERERKEERNVSIYRNEKYALAWAPFQGIAAAASINDNEVGECAARHDEKCLHKSFAPTFFVAFLTTTMVMTLRQLLQ